MGTSDPAMQSRYGSAPRPVRAAAPATPDAASSPAGTLALERTMRDKATPELVINLRTARLVGIAVPKSLVLRADDLIQ